MVTNELGADTPEDEQAMSLHDGSQSSWSEVPPGQPPTDFTQVLPETQLDTWAHGDQWTENVEVIGDLPP